MYIYIYIYLNITTDSRYIFHIVQKITPSRSQVIAQAGIPLLLQAPVGTEMSWRRTVGLVKP